jgi:hypothetical protein
MKRRKFSIIDLGIGGEFVVLSDFEKRMVVVIPNMDIIRCVF